MAVQLGLRSEVRLDEVCAVMRQKTKENKSAHLHQMFTLTDSLDVSNNSNLIPSE